MSILSQIKATKMREVNELDKNQLEYDRQNFLKSAQNNQRFANSLKNSGDKLYTLIAEIKKASTLSLESRRTSNLLRAFPHEDLNIVLWAHGDCCE